MKRTLCIFVTLLLVSLVSCTWDVSMPRRDPEFETIPQEYRGYWIAQPGDETADRFAIYEDRIEYYCPLGEYSITLDARGYDGEVRDSDYSVFQYPYVADDYSYFIFNKPDHIHIIGGEVREFITVEASFHDGSDWPGGWTVMFFRSDTLM